MWVCQVGLANIITPRSLKCLTLSTGTPPIQIDATAGILPEKHTTISLVLVQFSFVVLLLDQLTTASADDCSRPVVLAAGSCSHSVVSSTYFATGLGILRSFTWIIKTIGPKTVSCGTPAWTQNQGDLAFPTLILICLSVRKTVIHRVRKGGGPSVNTFDNNLSWSTVPKALLKSRNTTWIKIQWLARKNISSRIL